MPTKAKQFVRHSFFGPLEPSQLKCSTESSLNAASPPCLIATSKFPISIGRQLQIQLDHPVRSLSWKIGSVGMKRAYKETVDLIEDEPEEELPSGKKSKMRGSSTNVASAASRPLGEPRPLVMEKLKAFKLEELKELFADAATTTPAVAFLLNDAYRTKRSRILFFDDQVDYVRSRLNLILERMEESSSFSKVEIATSMSHALAPRIAQILKDIADDATPPRSTCNSTRQNALEALRRIAQMVAGDKGSQEPEEDDEEDGENIDEFIPGDIPRPIPELYPHFEEPAIYAFELQTSMRRILRAMSRDEFGRMLGSWRNRQGKTFSCNFRKLQQVVRGASSYLFTGLEEVIVQPGDSDSEFDEDESVGSNEESQRKANPASGPQNQFSHNSGDSTEGEEIE